MAERSALIQLSGGGSVESRLFGPWRIAYLTLAILIALHVALALAVGRMPVEDYWRVTGRSLKLWFCVLPFMMWYGGLTMTLLRRKVKNPLRILKRITIRNRYWLIRAAILFAAVVPLARSMTAVKNAIPRINPFYADPYFAQLDRLIFFGYDPWVLTHAVIGPFGTLVIDRLYIVWLFLTPILLMWFCFTRDRRFQIRGALTVFMCWVFLGNFLATIFSSVGPCFYLVYYGDDVFAPLMNTLHAYNNGYGIKSLFVMDFLLRARENEALGSGISAMPSLHVAIAFLMWLCCRERLKNRWLHRFAAAYAIAIYIGSIHLGWHYATDGIVSIAGVWLIWQGTGRFVDWAAAYEARRRMPERPAAVPVAA